MQHQGRFAVKPEELAGKGFLSAPAEGTGAARQMFQRAVLSLLQLQLCRCRTPVAGDLPPSGSLLVQSPLCFEGQREALADVVPC